MAFKVEEHLMQLQGKDYLEVKWRLVWFRQECPNGSIETEVVHLDLDKEVEAEVLVWNNDTRRREKVVKRAKGYCVFHAVVKDGKGGVGSGSKSESAVDFGDFIEKAESGAIGRALATLGYGTQFTGDELSEHHRIVDSPVDRPETGTAENTVTPARSASSQRQPAPAPRPAQSANAEKEPIDESPATPAQLNSMRTLYEALGLQMPRRSLTYVQAKKAIQGAETELRKKQDAAAVPLDQVSAEMAAQKQGAAV